MSEELDKEALRKARKARKAAADKAWVLRNPEKVNATLRAYRAANLEKVRAREKASRAANPEGVKANANAAWKARRDNLGGAYLRGRLGLPAALATPELLELKREQLTIKRLARQIKNQLKETNETI